MADYSLEALGHVVNGLRRGKMLTQEELGAGAGYGSGAGVSISRLEHGRLKPEDERLDGIARTLGVSTLELTRLAVQETRAQGRDADGVIRTHEERIAAIVRASEQRNRLAPEIEAFEEARERAEHAFLMRFRDTAASVRDAPVQDEPQSAQSGGPELNEAIAEASYQIQFTKYGVSRALANATSGATVGAAGGAAAYVAFAEAVALGTAPLGRTVPQLHGAAAALNALRAAMGLGRSAKRGFSTSDGMNLLAAVAVGTVVAAILERQASAKRSRKQQESAAKLAAAEEDIATNQANVEALLDVITRATELLDYIATHASHALDRWWAQIGDETSAGKLLGEADEKRYEDFLAIAAAQLAVATIDLSELATSRGSDLEHASAVADQILIQAHRTVTSRV